MDIFEDFTDARIKQILTSKRVAAKEKVTKVSKTIKCDRKGFDEYHRFGLFPHEVPEGEYEVTIQIEEPDENIYGLTCEEVLILLMSKQSKDISVIKDCVQFLVIVTIISISISLLAFLNSLYYWM